MMVGRSGWTGFSGKSENFDDHGQSVERKSLNLVSTALNGPLRFAFRGSLVDRGSYLGRISSCN